ncbi:MAG: PRC-barrel domain-containing protein [Dermatophilaceae bacterium]
MRLYAGTAVDSTDGSGGEVADLVVDPVSRRVTHLVVQHVGRQEGPRLIPVQAVKSRGAKVVLLWTTAQVLGAPTVEETDMLELGTGPHSGDGWDVGVIRMLPWPPNAGLDGLGYPMWVGGSGVGDQATTLTTYDRIPQGTAEIRRVSEVVGNDDHVVGHVVGLVVGPDYDITDVILDRGLLWSHREVTVPIGEVA